jgi:NADPH:quinone reductase-like Zn-dependent oxidoreductase
VYQQKVIIDQKRVFKVRSHEALPEAQRLSISSRVFDQIPSSLSFEDAATIPTGVITAGVALFHDLKLPLPDPSTSNSHPDPVLVWGGASSVGQFAIQLLKLAGYAKIFTTASSHNHDLVRSLGATEVLDYKNAEVVSEIIKANGGRKFKTVFDPVATEGSQVAVAGLVDENEGKVAVTLPKTAKFPSGAEVVSTFAYVIFFVSTYPTRMDPTHQLYVYADG